MNSRVIIAAAIIGGALAGGLVLALRARTPRYEWGDPPRTDDGDPITVASEDSFPASDPPSRTGLTGLS